MGMSPRPVPTLTQALLRPPTASDEFTNARGIAHVTVGDGGWWVAGGPREGGDGRRRPGWPGATRVEVEGGYSCTR